MTKCPVLFLAEVMFLTVVLISVSVYIMLHMLPAEMFPFIVLTGLKKQIRISVTLINISISVSITVDDVLTDKIRVYRIWQWAGLIRS